MLVFQERLKECVDRVRKKKSKTIEEIAEDLDIGYVRLRHYWERGSRPDHELLVRMADYFEVDLNWLFGRESTPEWPKADPLEVMKDKLASIEKKMEG